MTDVKTVSQTIPYNSSNAIDLIADKWTAYVLTVLRHGHNRFGQMQRAIPEITRKMLTQTLHKMERDGLISRIDYRETPPHVEYSLTPAGEALIARLTTLCHWANEFFPEVEAARARYDANNG